MNKISLILPIIFLSACLQTRDQIKKDEPMSETAKLQQKNAINESRFFEIDRDFRQLYGRVEVLEHQIGDGQKVKSSESNDRFEKLEKKISLLEEALTQLEASQKKGSDKHAAPEPKETNHFNAANDLFNNKKWEEAIVSYDEYLKANPKGKKNSEATYKIGLCFLNLGMKGDAKTFFNDVVQKYPKSKESDQAKAKLKTL